MSKAMVTFVGDGANRRDNPDSITWRGITFPIGEAIPLEVSTPDGEVMIGKMRRNSHFKVEDVGAEPEAAAPKASKAKLTEVK